MIQLLGLFLIIIALKLVVSTNNSPIAMSINGMVDNLVADDTVTTVSTNTAY